MTDELFPSLAISPTKVSGDDLIERLKMENINITSSS